jgi:hypothetical protein
LLSGSLHRNNRGLLELGSTGGNRDAVMCFPSGTPAAPRCSRLATTMQKTDVIFPIPTCVRNSHVAPPGLVSDTRILKRAITFTAGIPQTRAALFSMSYDNVLGKVLRDFYDEM